jgi:hypothetical protein
MSISRIRFLSVAVCGFSLFALISPAAHSQADLTFSGGSGAPLVLTLNTDISYTINNITALPVPVFVFKSVGNPINGTNGTNLVTITSLLNGGAPLTISGISSGFNVGAGIAANDIFLTGTSRFLINGDIITLTAGSLTTANTIAAIAPTDGSFTTFLTDSLGNIISTSGIATGGSGVAPEPASLALALPLLASGILQIARRCRK